MHALILAESHRKRNGLSALGNCRENSRNPARLSTAKSYRKVAVASRQFSLFGRTGSLALINYRRFYLLRTRTVCVRGVGQSPSPREYVFSRVGTSRCAVRATCSGATLSNAKCRSDIRSARYCAGGDGAARRPYHRAKHILPHRGRRKG